MKKAAIISIGNEIITGQIVDTNAAYLSSRLFAAGIPTAKIFQVPDDIDEIAATFAQAAQVASIIIVTGGLGPTADDLTRQGLAKYLGVELQLKPELLVEIEQIFTRRSIPMPEMNKIQAYIPAGCEPIHNPVGTAPGIWYCDTLKTIAVLPGVPSEMTTMFEGDTFPRITAMTSGQVIEFRKLKCFGMGESHIAEKLGSILDRGRNPLVNITVHYGVISLHIIASAKTQAIAKEMAQKEEDTIRHILGKMVFGTGEQTIAEVVGQLLVSSGKTLALAESCTGGLVAKLVTDIPGSSRYFTYGWVTYANQAKITQIGVNPATIERFGAVSEQTAAEMAVGARVVSGADFAISVTGIAGPQGSSEQKPQGLVYISIAAKDGVSTEKFIFPHTRDFMRLRTAQTALNLLRLKLLI